MHASRGASINMEYWQVTRALVQAPSTLLTVLSGTTTIDIGGYGITTIPLPIGRCRNGTEQE